MVAGTKKTMGQEEKNQNLSRDQLEEYCRETKVPNQLLDLLGDSMVLLTKVRN